MIPNFEILKRHIGRLNIDFTNLPNECVLGIGWKDRQKYVWIQFRDNKDKYAIMGHRAAYSLFNDVELTSNDVIMHSCDNPSCINPLHLSKGTHSDNVQDRVNKKRSAVGIKNGQYKHGKYVKDSAV